MVQLIVFLPLLAAIIAGLGNRMIGNFAAKLVTTGALFVGMALSWPIFINFLTGDYQGSFVEPVFTWIASDGLYVTWSLRVDALSAAMVVVLTTVSSLVHLYSWGYMAEDPGQPRFFAYLSLFSFAMLMLVTADSLVQMFFGWEGVGLASYLLIGFWYHKPSANAAALKAFVVNRVGDFGFSLGIFGTFLVFGTVSIPAILHAAPGMAGSTIGFAGLRVDTMTVLCLLLFVGAMGKSAQLPLHTWLPDAMEGPTPVSALIHAATMVTAGVYLIARMHPLFELAPAAADVGVIIAMGGEQNLDKMGGFRRAMPFTYGCFVVGGLALSGVPPFSGFFSKDEILLVMGAQGGWKWGLYVAGYLGAFLTAIYTWRMIFRAFFGDPVPEAREL